LTPPSNDGILYEPIRKELMSKNFFKSNQTVDAWWDDEELASKADRFDVQNPIGLTLAQVREWAENLCEQYGENSIMADLMLDEDFASIEIEKVEE
jgi:hypothetical protein